MIYAIIISVILILILLVLVWLRKVQFDAVHRNFLDLVDHYGGRIIRNGFAIRPKYSGSFNKRRISLSISTEAKTSEHPRRYYISIYVQAPGVLNFSILSNEWRNCQEGSENKKRYSRNIANKQYCIEATTNKIFRKLKLEKLEKIVLRMHPFAYALVSKNGIILERLSENLIVDTEFSRLSVLLDAINDLTKI
jgi:hypothetical protein